jgi:DNA-3-methyladenine glycosylase
VNILSQDFYTRDDVLQISRELLGKILVAKIDGIRTTGMIVETEAYKAPEDKACHAYNNRYTERTKTMFEDGGVAYVYVCYGIHHLFNAVTGTEGMAHAVLVRAIEPLEGLKAMEERRGMEGGKRSITNGPGKFTAAMGIRKYHNGLALWNAQSSISIWDDALVVTRDEVVTGPRVGMTSAEECAHWPWRFRIRNNKWTSKPDIVSYDQAQRVE